MVNPRVPTDVAKLVYDLLDHNPNIKKHTAINTDETSTTVIFYTDAIRPDSIEIASMIKQGVFPDGTILMLYGGPGIYEGIQETQHNKVKYNIFTLYYGKNTNVRVPY